MEEISFSAYEGIPGHPTPVRRTCIFLDTLSIDLKQRRLT